MQVWVGVFVGVWVGVDVGVLDGVAVAVFVGVAVGVLVGDAVDVEVGVWVGANTLCVLPDAAPPIRGSRPNVVPSTTMSGTDKEVRKSFPPGPFRSKTRIRVAGTLGGIMINPSMFTKVTAPLSELNVWEPITSTSPPSRKPRSDPAS